MNWYIVFLLFAIPEAKNQETVLCETCQVLFSAPTALAAYNKGVLWASKYIEESEFLFVGVEHIHSLSEEPADGVELSGSFHESEDVWQRRDELIPKKEELAAILWERGDIPLEEMMKDSQVDILKKVWVEEERIIRSEDE